MKISLLVFLLALGLTGCIDGSEEESETEIKKYQSPIGAWLSDCVEEDLPGLAGFDVSSNGAEYKIEKVIVSDEKFEKVIDFYGDDQCIDFLNRDEINGTYQVLSYMEKTFPLSESSETDMNEIKFETDCPLSDCKINRSEFFAVGNWSVDELTYNRNLGILFKDGEYYKEGVNYTEDTLYQLYNGTPPNISE